MCLFQEHLHYCHHYSIMMHDVLPFFFFFFSSFMARTGEKRERANDLRRESHAQAPEFSVGKVRMQGLEMSLQRTNLNTWKEMGLSKGGV
jgi:hypothetical protein